MLASSPRHRGEARASESGDGVVVVTGATGTLGGSVLARLRQSGARVIAVERTRILDREEVIGEVDLARAESVQQAFGLIARRGPIDAVIHTVGIYRGGADLLATRDQDFTSLFETNVLVTANVLRAALASML